MNFISIHPTLRTSTDDWLATFSSSMKERPLYLVDSSTWTFQRVGLRILGTPLEEDEYFNTLYKMKYESENIHILSEDLDRSIDNQTLQAIQELLEIHRKEPQGLSINRLIAFMHGKALIPKHSDASFNRHIQLSLIKVLEHFQKQHSSGLLSSQFRRFLIDIVKWLKNHWEKWSANIEIGMDLPKIVWYGELSESQGYFLALLMEFGCDVILFHPEGTDEFSKVDINGTWSITYEYSHKAKLEAFPTQLRERQSTVAYRANKQLEVMMNHHGSGIYKPWQFRDYVPTSTTLRMTYDDVFIYAREKAMIRPDFSIEDNRVRIPVIFAKIQGVQADRKQYWEHIHELIEHPLGLCIRQFPFVESTKANYQFHYRKSLDGGVLSPEKMMNGSWWRYKHLPNGLQYAIAATIKEVCEQPRLKKAPGESDEDLQVFLFKQANLIPTHILQLLQKYDYSQDIPRVVFYNMEKNGEPSREDAALLLFLNEFGLDLIWYNPAGHNDIEHYIDSSHYDTHWLEEVSFEQEFQEKETSFIKRMVKRFF